ncbi:hypothetical protein AB1K83_06460 [Sporosarcina sp. 179-K 3D1 HS]|uniref:hypothetical protein n=1 Tax=Sporosarcina sp. 179-K 3D1 HS TaxID=3232169 RepID=UPI00399F4EFF
MSPAANGDSASPYGHETATWSQCSFFKWAGRPAKRGGTAGHHALVPGRNVRGWVLILIGGILHDVNGTSR